MTEEEPVVFELIDLTSGNVINDFDHVGDALESIRRVAAVHGWETVGNLALMRLEGDDQLLVAMQGSLADLAASMEHATTASRVPGKPLLPSMTARRSPSPGTHALCARAGAWVPCGHTNDNSWRTPQ